MLLPWAPKAATRSEAERRPSLSAWPERHHCRCSCRGRRRQPRGRRRREGRPCQHGLSVTTADALAVGAEGSHEVGGGEKAVLVSIHDTERLLELLDGGVGERFKDVCFLRHFE